MKAFVCGVNRLVQNPRGCCAFNSKTSDRLVKGCLPCPSSYYTTQFFYRSPIGQGVRGELANECHLSELVYFCEMYASVYLDVQGWPGSLLSACVCGHCCTYVSLPRLWGFARHKQALLNILCCSQLALIPKHARHLITTPSMQHVHAVLSSWSN